MALGKIGELLVSQGLISEDQLKGALAYRQSHKTRLSSSLVKLGHVNEQVLTTFLSREFGIPAVSLSNFKVSADLARLVPRVVCERHVLVPIAIENQKITVAISDPSHVSALDDVRFISGMDVHMVLATESSILNAIQNSYAEQASEDLKKVVRPLESDENTSGTAVLDIVVGRQTQDVENERVGEKPVIRLINKLFVEAIRRKASDIHLEPYETHSRVRFRIDGVLHDVMQVPQQLKVAVPARVKVMASMDISEKRLPQDGRLQVRSKDRKIDIRVSTLPTMYGEKVVMRLLDQGSTQPTLKELGFEGPQLKAFQQASRLPYGMVLVTGPTGSGKSTTLYGALSELNSEQVNISTVEDPVEYHMLGVNQVSVRESIGMGFASVLRSMLRQDPDIIMVGEIRDHETAEISIKAALTGHLVFSTLHTNDAPSTISRLVHMGVERFLITAAVTLIQAQRLVRRICEHCSIPDERVNEVQLLEAGTPKELIGTFQPKRGEGCMHCSKTGYRGRDGIFEVMVITESIRKLIISGASTDDIKRVAIENGMITLRQHAIQKLIRGATTLEEVLNNSRGDGEVF